MSDALFIATVDRCHHTATEPRKQTRRRTERINCAFGPLYVALPRRRSPELDTFGFTMSILNLRFKRIHTLVEGGGSMARWIRVGKSEAKFIGSARANTK